MPVLVPAALVVFLVLTLRMQRRGSFTAARAALTAAVCGYGVGVLRSVLFPYPIVVGPARHTLPPWQVFLQTVPLATVPEDPTGMLLNVLLFVPAGILLPMMIRRSTLRSVLLAGFLLSLLIELTQLIGDVTISTGRIADVDDLIGNTLGTLLGYTLFLLLTRIPVLQKAAAAATVPASAPGRPKTTTG